MASRWGFVGRDEELQLLHAALADPGIGGIALSGPPGVGKTRLATEFLEQAASRGWTTRWVGTGGVAGVSFGAFAHLLPAGAATSSVETARLVSAELRRRGGARPIVLGVDDAHLLDDASAGLIYLLASSAHAFVVATVRRNEHLPDAIAALCQDGLARQIEVRALSRRDVAELLAAVLGEQHETAPAHLDAATTHRLWDASRGNVLFLHELVLTGLERGCLVEQSGVWSWVGELVCSDRLTELVADQLAGLSHPQRAALEMLALSEPLPTALFGSLVGPEVVQELYRSGLLTGEQQGRRRSVRLSYPLYAQTIRAGLGAVRKRALARRLVDALATTGARRSEDVLRAALWGLESGGSADPALLVAGARRALAVFDHELAQRLARVAIDEGGGPAARVVLASALYRSGHHDEARSAIPSHLPLGADDAVVAEWAMVASSIFFWGFGDMHRAVHLLWQAEQAVVPGPNRDLLAAHRASLAFFHGHPAEALAGVTPLLAQESSSDEITVAARVAAVPALAALGQCHAAVQLAEEGMPAGLRLMRQRPEAVGDLLAMHAVACWLAGRYRQLEGLATAAYQHVTAEKAHDLRGLWAMLLGRAALAAGLAATARHRLREACALLVQQGHSGLLPWALGCAAQAAALLGDVEEAQQAFAELRRCQLPAVRIFEWDTVLAQAWTAAARGEHSLARSLACQAADIAAGTGLPAGQLVALHDALRLGELRVAPQLVALAGTVDSALAPVFADHAAGLVDGDAAVLERCAAQFAELGALLLAAEAEAEAAEAHLRAGRTAARLAALRRSRQWAAVCEGAQPPSLRRTSGSPALEMLTDREREIAELATRGLSKREIADRLALSVRTVGNHLNHIYTKTGISGRAELAMLLGPAEPGTAGSVVGRPAQPFDDGSSVLLGQPTLSGGPGRASRPARRWVRGERGTQRCGEPCPGGRPVA